MDLFTQSAKKRQVGQPLAERMRPRSIGELVGQQHLLAPGKILSNLRPGAMVPSLILWGPPGSGKTTLARLIGDAVKADLVQLSAVDAGVKDVREAVAKAAERRDQFGARTLLFIDEVHRFSKTQQDALLPHVEAGTIILIGATTENPSFGVVAALLSRARVVRLEALSDGELTELVARAIADAERAKLGYVTIDAETTALVVAAAAGDARRLYAVLEVAAELAHAQAASAIDAANVAEAAQGKSLMYDRAGDEHYGVVSAFIKSMRGSDPDAAVYWMTRMLEAGEDPRFVIRRMVIFASEDVGNADPQALVIATAALAAVELVGLPEGVLPLTQAVTYLALAPKSNRALATYTAARAARPRNPRRAAGAREVAAGVGGIVSRAGLGHGGKSYKYPHDFEGAYVPEDYLPESIARHAAIRAERFEVRSRAREARRGRARREEARRLTTPAR